MQPPKKNKRITFFPPVLKREGFLSILILGEFPTEVDINCNFPFSSSGGKMLMQLLQSEGVNTMQCGMSYVFHGTPPEYKLDAWCDSKTAVVKEYAEKVAELRAQYPDLQFPDTYIWDKIRQGKYLRPEFLPELLALPALVKAMNPNVVLALGGTVCWALTGEAGIEKIRGAPMEISGITREDGSKFKMLATYHPAAVNKNWELAVILAADLRKLVRESAFAHIARPARTIYVPETTAELQELYAAHIAPATTLACDIEAHVGKDITCIGFAPSKDVAIVIPFSVGNTFEHYWKTQEEEVAALRFCRKLLEGRWKKTFHNGVFDIQYIVKFWRCFPKNCADDTMLMQHSLQPELPKSLGFLGTIYTNEAAWKIMRARAKDEMEKKDD